MRKFFHRVRIAGLAGLVLTILASALSAAPAAAIVCPPGVTNQVYCTKTPPVAITNPATDVGEFRATLNGVINGFGVNVRYFFQYGRTRAYGFTTRTRTLTGCPPGVTTPNYCTCAPGIVNPAYCVTPSASNVSALVRGLRSNTEYHFQLVAFNANGRVFGRDKTFRTHGVNPIAFVDAPRFVKHRKFFTVIVGLRTRARLTISLLFRDHVVVGFFKGSRAGIVDQRIRAPRKTGRYVIRVVASANGITQKVNKPITVF